MSTALVTELIQPSITELGLQLWGIEKISQGKHSLLRVYIESDRGVTIEDCARVSRQISGVLDVEDPISGEYTLEVSSPGVDRPLFSMQQYKLYIGAEVKIRLRLALAGRRRFRGVIHKVEGETIVLLVGADELSLPFRQIEKANIVFD